MTFWPVSSGVRLVQLSRRRGGSAAQHSHARMTYSPFLTLSDYTALPLLLLPTVASHSHWPRPILTGQHFLRESTRWPYFSSQSGLKKQEVERLCFLLVSPVLSPPWHREDFFVCFACSPSTSTYRPGHLNCIFTKSVKKILLSLYCWHSACVQKLSAHWRHRKNLGKHCKHCCCDKQIINVHL